jgi:hypothetical protein
VISLSRNGTAGTAQLLLSPNSVLANALLRSIDILRPRVLAARPARIEFVVGTQINGAPHLGTNLVQTAAFLLAKLARREFSIDTFVCQLIDGALGALDTPPARMPSRIFTPQILAPTGGETVQVAAA